MPETEDNTKHYTAGPQIMSLCYNADEMMYNWFYYTLFRLKSPKPFHNAKWGLTVYYVFSYHTYLWFNYKLGTERD